MSVTTFNKAMESHFKYNPDFRNVHVKGEVSDKYVSDYGHLYFNLKDKKSQVPCIVYKWFRKNLKFDIEDGMKLLVTANVTVYVPQGKYQLDVRSVIEDGLGQLFVKFQQLKKKLDNEGLFEDKYKKDLPRFPKRIGVITSRGGSVIHDIIKTIRQNWPYCQVFLFPAAVQGANSKDELVRQITKADNSNMDVLIVARGGGSIQDLWSYNEEEVVRCIFNANTPVISAIGHEDDVTLCDLVADRRASTPTMAASLAVEDKNAILENMVHYNSRLITFISTKVNDYKKQLDFILAKSIFTDSTFVYGSKKASFDDLCGRFNSASKDIINSRRMELNNITTEYVIRHPCKMQLDASRSNLNELQSRLIDAMEKLLNSNMVNLDKTTNKFKFLSEKLVTTKGHDLEIVKSYFKSNPCQSHIDAYKNELQSNKSKLIKEVNLKVTENKRDLDFVSSKTVVRHPELIYEDKSRSLDSIFDKFINVSNNLILAKSHKLDFIRASPTIQSPEDMCIKKQDELSKLEEKFMNASDKIIRDNTYRLDSYKKAPIIKNQLKEYMGKHKNEVENLSSRLEKSFRLQINENKKDFGIILNNKLFKNPQLLYEDKSIEFKRLVQSNVINNPYSILDKYKDELKAYEDKLDNINQILEIRKQQEKQKRTYILITVAIVVVMIILFIIIFGGIL